MGFVHCRRVVAVGVVANLASGCIAERSPDDGRLSVEVAPLTLPGLTDVAYDLRVVNDLGDTVWERTALRASAYGDGTSLSYVGACDADPSAQPNTVELTVATLYDADGALDADTWVSPTADSPLSLDVDCLADADVAVTFDVSVMRRAQQGFFDIAVEFDDIFCSAKFDCELPSGDPIRLVSGADGTRLPTAVLALACTSGPGGDTVVYLDDLQIDCGGSVGTVDVDGGPGNLYALSPSTAPSPLAQAMIFRGVEQLTDASLGDLAKRYVNVALAVDFAQTSGACTLTTNATAHDGPLTDGETPTGTYPVIRYEIPLVNSAGDGYDCGRMALDDPAGVPGDRVASTYVTTPPGEDFDVAFAADLTGLGAARTAECRDGDTPPGGLCVGVCTASCVDGAWTCGGAGYEADEVTCDALDNDCDGETDEGGICPPCTSPLEYDSPGTYNHVVQAGCSTIRVDLVGGGGGGGQYQAYRARSGGGGGAGGHVTWSLSPGDALTITVGAAGAVEAAGGASSVSGPAGTITAGGGGAGQRARTAVGGAGGVMSGSYDGGSTGGAGGGCSCEAVSCSGSHLTHTCPPGLPGGAWAAGGGACATGINGGTGNSGGAAGSSGYGGDGGVSNGGDGFPYGGGGGGGNGVAAGGYVRLTLGP